MALCPLPFPRDLLSGPDWRLWLNSDTGCLSFAGAFAFSAFILSLLLLQEPERNPENERTQFAVQGIKKMFAPIFLIPFMIILISTFGLASFESLFALFADHKFAFTPKDIAIMITGGAIVGAVVQVFLFDRMTLWWGEIRLIRYSFFLSIILVFLMTVVKSYWSIMCVTFTVFIGFDIIRPAVTNYLSKIAGNEQGLVGGMNSMFTSLGNVFGPIAGGMLFDINLDYPFYFSSVILTIGLGLTYIGRMTGKKKPFVKAVNKDIRCLP